MANILDNASLAAGSIVAAELAEMASPELAYAPASTVALFSRFKMNELGLWLNDQIQSKDELTVGLRSIHIN